MLPDRSITRLSGASRSAASNSATVVRFDTVPSARAGATARRAESKGPHERAKRTSFMAVLLARAGRAPDGAAARRSPAIHSPVYGARWSLFLHAVLAHARIVLVGLRPHHHDRARRAARDLVGGGAAEQPLPARR